MAYSVDTNTRTPFTQLRESLDKAERLVVQVDSATVAEFLTLLDSIEEQFETLQDGESDLRSEQSRWEGLLRRISAKPEGIVRAANAAGGLAKLRAANPPATNFWWHLDSELNKRRLSSFRRSILTAVTVVVVAVAGYYAINYFFPPDPEAVLMVETTNSLERLISEQRWQEALDLVMSVRAQLPTNSELLVWEAVLNERLGNEEAAASALAEAQKTFTEKPALYWVTVGNSRLQVGDIEGSQEAADQAVTLDPNEPQAYFLMGNLAETLGDVPAAIQYFDKTSALAEGSNAQLAVIARVRMGQLLQSPGSLVSPATSPTPVP